MRTNPVSSRYWNWETFGTVVGASVDTVDRHELLALVTAHEGPESAAIAARWLQQQPEAFTVYRIRGELAGMVAWLTLTKADDDVRADPVAAAAWRHVEGHGPPAPGEQVLLNRFTIDRDLYQDPSPAVDLNSVIHVELTVTRPKLAWVMMTMADTDSGYRSSPRSGTTGTRTRRVGREPSLRVVRARRTPAMEGRRRASPAACQTRRGVVSGDVRRRRPHGAA